MTIQPLSCRVAALALAIITMVATSSCRRKDHTGAREAEPVVVVAPELMTNRLGTLPGAIYQSQALSPIRWQPWTADTLERARDARRLVLCVIAIPQQPAFVNVIKALESDPDHLRALNEEYVPVLVDADAARELGIITSDLCAEINKLLNLPLFVWMTHEANPVAWLPMSSQEVSKTGELFNQSHNMVLQIWRDDPAYVIHNSRKDNDNRRSRIEMRVSNKVISTDPARDLLRALRQLTSLYDPLTRYLDEAGGLLPTSTLELLAAASVHPGLPEDLRETCLITTRELTKDLLDSAMFDPLDGGVFSARAKASWSLPKFTKNCIATARMIFALSEVYRATGDRRVIEQAMRLIAHVEEYFATPDGLFAIGFVVPTPPEAWMWGVEDVRELLGPDDAGWWIQATGMKGLGNLPSEVDPRREFFRANTLSLTQHPAENAVAIGINAEEFNERFESARRILLEARNQRLGRIQRDESPHAQATLRMVSAYAAAFSATGEESCREKAVELLERARATFSDGSQLRMFASTVPPSVGAGRNFLYALAMQAAMDVAAITGDEKWLIWSEDLATTAAELFTGDNLLKECPESAELIQLPITDLVMLFDDSSAGLISMAEGRLAAIERPLVESFSMLATPLPGYAREAPLLHTDLLMAALVRHYRITAVYGQGLSPAMKTAVERLPPRALHRRPARPDENIPAAAVELQFDFDGRKILVTTPAQLVQEILPAASMPPIRSVSEDAAGDSTEDP
jgi:uncharacterized protein YyaL (SSP411 family)